MATKLALLLALLLSVVVAVASAAEPFDFYYFVQEWLGSNCVVGACCAQQPRPESGFGIHGLRPAHTRCRTLQNDDGGLLSIAGEGQRCWPESCNDANSKLRPAVVEALFESLRVKWPSNICRTAPFDLWSREWQKHGTCSDMDQQEYFETAMALKSRSDLASVLADAGIVPSATQTYFLSSIRDAIEGATGFKVNLECEQDFSGEAVLYRVYQCVDRQGKEFIDCPDNIPGNCSDRVRLPELFFD